MVLVNPGDEVIVFDPYFVLYDSLSAVIGGKVVYLDTYPDFRIDLEPAGRRDHAADQGHHLQQPGKSHRRRGRRADGPRRGRTGRAAERGPDQRRDLSGVLLRPAVRLAGQLQSADAGGRRLQQDLRDARLAAGVCPRPLGHHPRDDQAPAVQFRLRRSRRNGPGPWRWTWT